MKKEKSRISGARDLYYFVRDQIYNSNVVDYVSYYPDEKTRGKQAALPTLTFYGPKVYGSKRFYVTASWGTEYKIDHLGWDCV